MAGLVFPFEVIAALFIYSVKLEHRDKFFLKLGIIVMVDALFAIGISIYSKNWNAIARVESNANLVLTIISCFVIVGIIFMEFMILFAVQLKEAVYCVTCAYISEHMAYCIRLLLAATIGSKWTKPGSLLYFLSMIIIYAISYYAFARKMIRNGHYVTTALQSLGLMLCVSFLVIGLSLAASRYGFDGIHGIYALFCCGFVLYSQVKQQNQLQLQKELSIQESLWVKMKTQYEMSKENIDLINAKCHDLKHQAEKLRSISNVGIQKETIDTIEDILQGFNSILQTGNEILDTILTEQSLICSKNQIDLMCIADGKILNFMDTVDLYSLFSGAMESAIADTLKLKPEERAISIMLHEKVGLVILQFENPYLDAQLNQEEKTGLERNWKETETQDERLKVVRNIVEKYQGFVTIETDNNIYILRITFP